MNDSLSSYLTNQSFQATQIDSYISNKRKISCGVPQGSVLGGPLYFLIYINDLHKCSDIFDFHLFADDTSLLYANKSLASRASVINNELNASY